MAATINELAEKLHLSKGTISRILNDKGDAFSPETRRRVLAAAQEVGYRPSHVARALATGRTGLIALWLWSDGYQDSYHARVSQVMQATFMPHPYQMMICPVGPMTLEFAQAKALSPWDVDGIVAHEAAPAVLRLGGADAARRRPIVSTGAFNLLLDADLVGIDLSSGAREAMRHLLAPGRRRIAFVSEWPAPMDWDPRYAAYASMMAEAGLATEFIGAANPGRAAGREAILRYVAENSCPDALFCHTDTLAIGAYRGLRDLGVRVPDDVSIVGCDGIEDTEYLDVPLSTIEQPLEEMCRLAWDYLVRRMENPTAPIRQIWLQPHLRIRASSQT